ncbi:MAG TPA: BON domain-containing protein [Pyrinomonadaceae bacterium]|nr:BON domain-containing protein [Pyrinomonadaceae bacterium]
MGRIRYALIAGVAALAALATGCQATVNTNNTNAAVTANANVYSNANVYPNTNANTGANANANANSNGGVVNANITREDFERQKERFQREAREAGRKIGPGASDLWVWTKARAALAAAQDLRDSTVSVDVDNSVVTLTGTVASNEQKIKAGQVAKVEGAARVVNNLTVSAGGANANANTK